MTPRNACACLVVLLPSRSHDLSRPPLHNHASYTGTYLLTLLINQYDTTRKRFKFKHLLHNNGNSSRDHQGPRPHLLHQHQRIRRRRKLRRSSSFFPRTRRTKSRSSRAARESYTIFLYTRQHQQPPAQEYHEENFTWHHQHTTKKISSIQCSANKDLSPNIRRPPMLFLGPSTFIRLDTHFGTDRIH